jgi:CheY-like chemotaxis protein
VPRVLVVDDEPEWIQAHVGFLRYKGYDTTLVTDTGQAIKYLDEKGDSLDCVVVDILMPRLKADFFQDDADPGGVQVLRYLRLEMHSAVPVIFLTVVSYTNARAAIDTIESQVRGAYQEYIEKPVGVTRVARAVQKAILAYEHWRQTNG